MQIILGIACKFHPKEVFWIPAFAGMTIAEINDGELISLPH
jgi:hypothetical protein